MRRPPVHCPGHQLRAHDTGGDAPRHDQRQRPRAALRRHAIGGRETKRQHHCRIAAAKEGRQAEQPEPAHDDGRHGQQACQYASQGSRQEGGAPAMPAGNRARGKNARRHADHENRNRQGRQHRRWGQHVADNRASGVDHHRVRARQRLRDGQAPDIAALNPVGQYAGEIRHRSDTIVCHFLPVIGQDRGQTRGLSLGRYFPWPAPGGTWARRIATACRPRRPAPAARPRCSGAHPPAR
ncbi:Uncharacterised protein [Bordetella pertussis]|nr:Uncharacterised protein [Bordetella pertussis]CPO46275.1 Uncharacterised protein [Bordetella pertussis]